LRRRHLVEVQATAFWLTGVSTVQPNFIYQTPDDAAAPATPGLGEYGRRTA
jgi:hypothetical protein